MGRESEGVMEILATTELRESMVMGTGSGVVKQAAA